MEAITHAGQKVRVRPSSPAARDWQIPRDAEGTVICQYRLLRGGPSVADRVDVRFSPKLVVWGAPSCEFETIGESSLALQQRRTR